METSIVKFHQKLYIPFIHKRALHLPHIHILFIHNCVNLRQEAFKRCAVYLYGAWYLYYTERVVPSFSRQIQSEYYFDNIYVSIEGIILE